MPVNEERERGSLIAITSNDRSGDSWANAKWRRRDAWVCRKRQTEAVAGAVKPTGGKTDEIVRMVRDADVDGYPIPLT